jgi:hypothetical protein
MGKTGESHGKIWGKYREKNEKKTLENGEVLVKIHGKMKL